MKVLGAIRRGPFMNYYDILLKEGGHYANWIRVRSAIRQALILNYVVPHSGRVWVGWGGGRGKFQILSNPIQMLSVTRKGHYLIGGGVNFEFFRIKPAWRCVLLLPGPTLMALARCSFFEHQKRMLITLSWSPWQSVWCHSWMMHYFVGGVWGREVNFEYFRIKSKCLARYVGRHSWIM